jgi:hypothetical protein
MSTDVETITLISLKIRCDPHNASERSESWFRTRHPLQRNPCWKIEDKTNMIDTIGRGWICPPIYVIPRNEYLDICSYGEDHVFDGAHKAEAGIEFLEGKFPIKYKDTELSFGILKEYQGKYFKDLPKEMQEKIKKYKFHINYIDSETANNPDALRILWQRLNMAGKKLNDYELSIPIIQPLIEQVLIPCKELFLNSPLFMNTSSNRGDLEQRMQLLLALSEISKLSDIKNKSSAKIILYWHQTVLGQNMQARNENVVKQKEKWISTLQKIHKMMNDMKDLNAFHTDEGESLLATNIQSTELPYVLGRLAHAFDRIEDFRSKKIPLVKEFKEKIFSRTATELNNSIGGGSGRNQQYQKKLLEFIDAIIKPVESSVQRRVFTKKEKESKLKLQNGKCTLCNEKILKHQVSEGDHIVEWSEGGETTLENLQVVHKHCHQEKTRT